MSESPTTVAPPTVSPEVQQKAASLKLRMHLKRAEELSATINDAQSRIAGIALLNALGIKEEATLPDAITIAINRRAAAGVTIILVETATKATLDLASNGRWDDLLSMADGNAPAAKPEPTPAPQPVQPKPAPVKAAAPKPITGGRNVIMPEFNIPAVPTLARPSPTDPMAGFVNMLEPRWQAAAAQAQANAMSSFGPILEALVKNINEANAQTGNGGSVDEESVKRIVTKSLSNGTGEELKRLVAAQTPNVIIDVLTKAADAIAAAAPQTNVEVKLMAAFEPIPDPNYAWTADLEAVAEMLNTSRHECPQNAMLVGPTGCGKTEFAIQFAAKFGLKVMVMDCANIREARDWFGQKGAANGSTFFRKSQFWLALEAGNCVILLDEFNRAADHVRNPLMPILDNRRRSFVEEVGETLAVGPGVVFFATLNEGLDYSGTHTTDKAMKNRFPRRIELNYLPDNKEVQVLCDKVANLRPVDARKLVDVANVIRTKASGFGGTLTESLSTRQLIAAAKDYVIMGPRSFQYTVFNHFNADDAANSERAQVVQMFEGKGFILNNPNPSVP